VAYYPQKSAVAESELSIPYRSRIGNAGLVITGTLVPVWGIMAPLIGIACLGLLIKLALMGGADSPATLLLAFAFCLVISSVGIVSLINFAEKGITLNKEGICLPGVFLFALALRRQRKWKELTRISLDLPDATTKTQLRLFFQNGSVARLFLHNLDKENIEQLLLALEVRATEAEKDVSLTALLGQLHDERANVGELSYTQMWEEELNRRFASTAFVPLQPGQLIQGERLKIIRQLAFGGLSAIYLAQLNGTEAVVLKESVVPDSADENLRNKARQMFDREANYLRRLNHSNIAKVHDHFVESDRHYLMLEYLEGEDLRQVVRQAGPRDEETVLEWAFETADILKFLHNQEPPIVHRDLTPDNLVLRNAKEVVLIDFGAANELIGTATGTLVGKQAYIAPEQFQGHATAQSDLYALGGTMYFLLTGQDPEALATNDPRAVNPQISDDVAELVIACNQFDAGERVPSADEVMVRIKQIQSKRVPQVIKLTK
jgi:serine/threonine-protein kinase